MSRPDPIGREYIERAMQHRPRSPWALAAAMRDMSAQGFHPNTIAAATGCDPAQVRTALATVSPAAEAATGPTAAAAPHRVPAAGDPFRNPSGAGSGREGMAGVTPASGGPSFNNWSTT